MRSDRRKRGLSVCSWYTRCDQQCASVTHQTAGDSLPLKHGIYQGTSSPALQKATQPADEAFVWLIMRSDFSLNENLIIITLLLPLKKSQHNLLTLTRCALKTTLTLSVQSAWSQSAKLLCKIFRILSLSYHDTPPILSNNLFLWSCTHLRFSHLALLARSLNLISQQILALATGSSLYSCRSFQAITNHRVAGHFHTLTWQAHGLTNYSRSSLEPVSA